MKSATSKTASSRASLIATVAIVACLIAQVGRVSHMLLVRHATCAEHGELVHLDGKGKQATAIELSDACRVKGADGPAEPHAHDHCVVAGTRREERAVADPVVAAGPPDAARGACLCAGHGVPPHGRLPVYRLAPKGSPPIRL